MNTTHTNTTIRNEKNLQSTSGTFFVRKHSLSYIDAQKMTMMRSEFFAVGMVVPV